MLLICERVVKVRYLLCFSLVPVPWHRSNISVMRDICVPLATPSTTNHKGC